MASPPVPRTTRTRWRRSSTLVGSPPSPGSPPIPLAAASAASTRASCGHCLSRPPPRRNGAPSRTRDGRRCPTTTPLPTCTSSRARTAVHWTHPPRILSEHLAPLPEPLAFLLTPGAAGPAPAVAARRARALLDLTPLALEGKTPWPAWLAPHQVPAAERLIGILGRHGGALLADAVGLGKSYVSQRAPVARSEEHTSELQSPCNLVCRL